LKGASVKGLLPLSLGDCKLPMLFAEPIGRFLRDKGGSGKDKLERVYRLQLFLKGFIGVDGEGGSRDLELGAWSNGPLQIIPKKVIDRSDPRFLDTYSLIGAGFS